MNKSHPHHGISSKVFILLQVMAGIWLFLSSVPCFAADYYIDAVNGIDTNDGLALQTAWKTISRVNSANFLPGDSVLFKRGQTWQERLDVPDSGSAEAAIRFGAYGEGKNPLITGESERNYAITVQEKEYIVIENIDCEYSLLQNIVLYKSHNCIVRNLSTAYAKRDGLRMCYGASDNLIENVTSHHNGEVDHGGGILIDTQATRNTVRRCSAYQNAEDGLGSGGWPGNYGGPDNILEYNDSYDNHESGADIKSGPQIVRYNKFHHNHGTYDNEGEGIALTYESVNVQIYGNEIYGNDWNGIRISNSNVAGSHIITGNRIYNNKKRGIYGHGSSSSFNKIHYNLIYNNSQMGVFLQTPSTELYNNVIWGNSDYQLRIQSIDNIVKNNIIGGRDYAIAIENDGATGLISDYNCLLGAGNFCMVDWKYYDFGGWQTLTGQDSHSLSLDPKFEGVSVSNFHLQSDSPLIDAGVDLALIKDFDGVSIPQGNAPDIGAYEYTTASPFMYGDVTEDGTVSAMDASWAAQNSVGLLTLTPEQTRKADVTGNGEVSAFDASWIGKKAVDPQVIFPIEE